MPTIRRACCIGGMQLSGAESPCNDCSIRGQKLRLKLPAKPMPERFFDLNISASYLAWSCWAVSPMPEHQPQSVGEWAGLLYRAARVDAAISRTAPPSRLRYPQKPPRRRYACACSTAAGAHNPAPLPRAFVGRRPCEPAAPSPLSNSRCIFRALL